MTDTTSVKARVNGEAASLTPLSGSRVAITPESGGETRIVELSDLIEREHLAFEYSADKGRVASLVELSAELGRPGGERQSEAPVMDGYTDDELLQAWQTWRAGDAHAPDEQEGAANLSDAADEGDPAANLTDDDLYDAWKRQYAAERGVDLSTVEDASSGLEPGEAVEWGEGFGIGHGIVMEVDTASGSVNVHACDVVESYGAGEQLSPTGQTIKVDGSKLRRSSLKPIGTEPIGPELSDDSVGTDADSDGSFWIKVRRQMRRMGGGFDG